MGKFIRVLIGSLISIIFIFILYKVLDFIGFFNILAVINSVNWFLFLAAVVSYFLSYYTWTIKWKELVSSIGKISKKKIMLILFSSSFFYSTTPGPRIGGEPVRLFYTSKIIRKTKSEVLATILFDRSTSTIAIQLLSIFSILFILGFSDLPQSAKNILMLTLFFIMTYIVFRIKYYKKPEKIAEIKFIKWAMKTFYKISPTMRYRFKNQSGYVLYVKDRIKRYNDLFFKFNNNKKLRKRQIFLSMFRWLLTILSVYLLFISTGTFINPLAILIVQVISMIIGSLSFIPGGIGVQESVMIALYFAFGIDTSIAATVAILSRVITYFYSLFVGPACLIYLSKTTKKKKKKNIFKKK